MTKIPIGAVRAMTVASLALAACGGSGGSNSAASGTVVAQTPAAPAVQNFVLWDGSTMTLDRDASGNLTSVTYEGLSYTRTDAPGPFAGGENLTGPAGQLESMGRSNGLASSDFGVVSNGGALNFYSGGLQTDPSQLPPLGANITANFQGSYIAQVGNSGLFNTTPIAIGTTFSGPVQITANFADRSMSSNWGGMLGGLVETGGPNAIGSDGLYSVGTFEWFPTPQTLAVMANGRFYGASNPNQAPLETAGTIQGSLGQANFTGSFGAHR
jgi:hypothetical protein